MKNIVQYIASILLALFALSLVPYNAMHSHAEDEHAAAILHRGNDPTHHCELDSDFCQAAPGTNCGHPTHLSPSHLKCFACEFQFVKVYAEYAATTLSVQVAADVVYLEFVPLALNSDFFFVGNKGPPFSV